MARLASRRAIFLAPAAPLRSPGIAGAMAATTTVILRGGRFRAPFETRRVHTVQEESHMAWNTPVLVEICIGMEINAYAPAEF
jgi:coenzyme PQQ precursor peptide PqqA